MISLFPDRILGLGIMRYENLSDSEIISNIRYAYESGIRYFETASFYLNNRCQSLVSRALSIYSRESYYLCAKLCLPSISNSTNTVKYFYSQLLDLNTDYIDVYLIQGITRYHIDTITKHNKFVEAITYLDNMKSLGVIKYLGFSFHDNIEILKKVFSIYDKWNCIQLKINYHDMYFNLGLRDVYNYVVSRDIPIIVMSPLAGGLLGNRLPDNLKSIYYRYIPNLSPSSTALRYINQLDNIKIVLTGASDKYELDSSISAFSSTDRLSREELAFIELVNKMYSKYHTIDCIHCRYCESICDMDIAISEQFRLYNLILSNRAAARDRNRYIEITKSNSGYHRCINCRRCIEVCPQHLDIPKFLSELHNVRS